MNDNLTTTVVIPAYGPTPFLRQVLAALANQARRPDETIVSHSGSDDPSDWIKEEFPEVRVFHSEERMAAGVARNRGSQLATSEVLLFCDSDVLPGPHWIVEHSVALAQSARRFVVGSVGMARTGGYWGQGNWLCEFSEQAPWRPEGTQAGGASCNMAVRRADFEAVGGFRTDMPGAGGEDTLLFHDLRARGIEQWFAPKATVGHFNNSGFEAFAKHQRNLGASFARSRARGDLRGALVMRHRWMAYGLWLPKDALIIGRALQGGAKGAAMAFAWMPAIVLGGWLWTAGCVAGLRSEKS